MMRNRLVFDLAVLLGLSLLLGMLGPFGSFAQPLPIRLFWWTVFLLGGALFFRPVVGAARALARHGAVPLPLGLALACLLAAFPTTLLVNAGMAGMEWGSVSAGSLARLYPQVVLIGLVAVGLRVLAVNRMGASPPSTSDREAETTVAVEVAQAPDPAIPAPGDRSATPFLDRLPASLGRDLLCLENEDHYVRAHTARGSTLILMRLGDAVAELDGIEGLRTHRSWWVARSAVSEVRRRERAVVLALRNGIEAPVSRNTVPVLRQSGWLTEGEA